MEKLITLVLALMTVSILSFSTGKTSKPVLKFNPDGKFKIVQFTDVHFKYDSYRSDSAMVIVKKVVTGEKPDLVIFTGDVVCSEDTRKAWLSFSETMTGLKTPWAIVLGNHDIEGDLTGIQIMETIVKMPYCITENGPKDIAGNGNYVLKIQSSKSSKTEALLYCLDSHSSFKPQTNLGTYEWIAFSQVDWYREQSRSFTKRNGGIPLPALAFFHIPLPEYKEVVGKSTTVGSQIETVCSPEMNSGLYTAILEKKDVMGVFAGHDHNDNFIGCLRDICLAYGNVTGRQCYGDIGRGARVIELYEGQRKFDTWILKLYECNRDKDIWFPADNSQPQYIVSYPDSFKEPETKLSK